MSTAYVLINSDLGKDVDIIAKIIHETQGGFIFNYDDSKGIVDLILDPKNIYSKNIYKYDRKELTGQLCQLFSNLVN